VIQNLLGNALKFSKPAERPVIHIYSEIVAEKSFDCPVCPGGKYCRIHISDNGIGFDDRYLDRIFAMFQRLNPKEAYEGTGMGLAIVKKIIGAHKGIITANSKEGEGATFTIVIPISHEN